MEPADDPDPGGSHHPTVFYGLWPRFSVDDAAGESVEAEPAPSPDG